MNAGEPRNTTANPSNRLPYSRFPSKISTIRVKKDRVDSFERRPIVVLINYSKLKLNIYIGTINSLKNNFSCITRNKLKRLK